MNFKLAAPLAAIGLARLPGLDQQIRQRTANARVLLQAVGGTGRYRPLHRRPLLAENASLPQRRRPGPTRPAPASSPRSDHQARRVHGRAPARHRRQLRRLTMIRHFTATGIVLHQDTVLLIEHAKLKWWMPRGVH